MRCICKKKEKGNGQSGYVGKDGGWIRIRILGKDSCFFEWLTMGFFFLESASGKVCFYKYVLCVKKKLDGKHIGLTFSNFLLFLVVITHDSFGLS